jgi:hypothetical protein
MMRKMVVVQLKKLRIVAKEIKSYVVGIHGLRKLSIIVNQQTN